MVKKREVRKNSRAARQAALSEPEIEIAEPIVDDSRERVLKELAIKDLRSGNAATSAPLQSGLDELDAIAKGAHPEQRAPSRLHGRVGKRSSKKDRRKAEKAQMVRDMLSEKIEHAKKRHKTVRKLREKDEEPQS